MDLYAEFVNTWTDDYTREGWGYFNSEPAQLLMGVTGVEAAPFLTTAGADVIFEVTPGSQLKAGTDESFRVKGTSLMSIETADVEFIAAGCWWKNNRTGDGFGLIMFHYPTVLGRAAVAPKWAPVKDGKMVAGDLHGGDEYHWPYEDYDIFATSDDTSAQLKVTLEVDMKLKPE